MGGVVFLISDLVSLDIGFVVLLFLLLTALSRYRYRHSLGGLKPVYSMACSNSLLLTYLRVELTPECLALQKPARRHHPSRQKFRSCLAVEQAAMSYVGHRGWLTMCPAWSGRQDSRQKHTRKNRTLADCLSQNRRETLPAPLHDNGEATQTPASVARATTPAWTQLTSYSRVD